ncbi:unnamed protein product [Polarella glacialis]|uniref:WW domain-containing protein n=1 Tax=Polarella glacialis TaxID=89957 RepID=A0A813EGH2_POLGL|nr:unnamed protein product [Polarella glacialis]
MEDEMAMFEAELAGMSSPVEEKQIGKETQTAAVKRGREEKEDEETGEKGPKLSLIEQAKRRWKPQSIADKKALEAEAKGKWTEQKDTEGTYYYNSITKVSSRTRPPDFVDTSLDPFVFEGTVWKVSTAGNGELFYTNEETGQSQCQRPGEVAVLVAKIQVAATPTAVADATRAASLPDGEEPDEIFDLVGRTAPSDFLASAKMYARVSAESEDGLSIIGFHLRLNTPFAYLMEAWADHMEVPVPSVYFEFGGKVLTATQTPAFHGWSAEHGTFKIEAKPCEEIEETDSEADEEDAMKKLMKDAVLAEWKKEQKQRRRASKPPA